MHTKILKISSSIQATDCYTVQVQETIWKQLTTPFAQEALTWKILDISEDQTQAKVRPQLSFKAVVTRLDTTLGKTEWSMRYVPLSDHCFSCELTILGTTKSSVVSSQSASDNALAKEDTRLAQDAFVSAAEFFGIQATTTSDSFWVDFDPKTKTCLQQPSLSNPSSLDKQADAEKPAGQQAIDRLVDRLKQEGLGLDAAKLLVAHGGYGHDVTEAKALYTKLRELLKQERTLTS